MTSTRPRVGLDAVRALRNTTGLGNYARGVILGLAGLTPGFELSLYSPRPPVPQFADFLALTRRSVTMPPPWLRFAGGREYWRTFRLGRRAAADGVDLWHGLSQEIPRDLPAAGMKSVVTVADLLYHTDPGLFPLIDRLSYRWRYRWSAHGADAVVAISDWTKELLVQEFGVAADRIAVIPPCRDERFATDFDRAAIDAVRTRHGIPERYFIAVGTLEPRKRQRAAIAAMAKLPPGSSLLLVGRDGGSAAALGDQIELLGLQDRVLIRTQVSGTDLPPLVAGATGALYLSRAEGFGMPIVEAMTAGVPVITADGPHLRDAGGGAAITCSPDDPDSLAEAMQRLVTDREWRDSTIRAGRSHAAYFTRPLLAERLATLYHAVLAGNAIPATALTFSSSATEQA